MAARDQLGEASALLVANPLPPDKQLDPAVHDQALAGALKAADQAAVRGKAVTPYLLAHMQQATEGASVAVNLDVARGNIALAAEIAAAWVRPRAACAAHHPERDPSLPIRRSTGRCAGPETADRRPGHRGHRLHRRRAGDCGPERPRLGPARARWSSRTVRRNA